MPERMSSGHWALLAADVVFTDTHIVDRHVVLKSSPPVHYFELTRPMTSRTQVKTVRIAADQSLLSKGQKAFNTLIKQIEKKRAQLAAWEATIPPYQQKYASELVPLVESSVDLQVEMVHCLDRASDQKGLTIIERRMIADLITELAGGIAGDRDDAELKAVYNKHSQSDYDKETAANIMGMKSMLEDALGMDLGDDLDMSSPEDILNRAHAKMQQAQEQFEADRQAREERRSKRKKTAKQIAREAQQQAEEQHISQSIREVYRKLASALHPDRETDPQERERKTVLMRRANDAYAKKNLLQLFELQLELEHIDQASINGMSEERIKHYNKVLKEQLAELDQEIMHVEGRFRAQFDISPFFNVAPSTIMRNLERDIVGIKHAISELKRDLLAFEDIKKVKAWLKDMRRQSSRGGFDDVPF